jgi:hypothetical protein
MSMHLIKQSVRDDATGLFVHNTKFILFLLYKISNLFATQILLMRVAGGIFLMAVLCHSQLALFLGLLEKLHSP